MITETIGSISSSLDAVISRHRVIANNIANAKANGFVATRTSFDVIYDRAAQTQKAGFFPTQPSSVPSLELHAEQDLDGFGMPRTVELDDQLAALSENTLLYNFLARAISKQLSVLNIAISDGKR